MEEITNGNPCNRMRLAIMEIVGNRIECDTINDLIVLLSNSKTAFERLAGSRSIAGLGPIGKTFPGLFE